MLWNKLISVFCFLNFPTFDNFLKLISLLLFSSTRPTARSASSIILRGPNDFYCDEMERSIHDALCVVKRVLESQSLVCGGGSVEAALSVYLENFATSLVSIKKIWIF